MDGRYIYCIMEWNEQNIIPANLGNIGISESPVYTISYKDVCTVVSNIPFQKMESSINDIVAHQRVVEAARATGATVLPVRFGVILKNEESVKKLIASSQKDYRAKIAQLRGKDEIGIKVLLDKSGLKKIETMAQEQSEEIQKIKQEIACAQPGTSYFLKLRLQDAVKSETLKKIDKMTGEINTTLGGVAEDTMMLKNELGEIVFNGAYLVDRKRMQEFDAKVKELRAKFEYNGMTIHQSGPWAPYSFC